MSSIKCPKCNLTNWATAVACKRCGSLFQSAGEGAEFIPVSLANNESFVNTNEIPDGNYQAFQSSAVNERNYQGFQPPVLPANNSQNYQYQNHRQPNYSNYQPANLKSGMAIASMVLGILGFVTAMFLVGILFAPVGLILGIVALVKASKKPHIYGGKAFAIVGVILSSLIVLIIPIVMAIAIPNLLAARRAANEGSAISRIRTIASAEATYKATTGQGKCGDLMELSRASLISPDMAQPERMGYRYSVVKIPSLAGDCEVTAAPTVTNGVSATGTRSFYYSTEDNVIRASTRKGVVADKNDLPLNSSSSDYPGAPPRIASR